jgi:hypothetical protein
VTPPTLTRPGQGRSLLRRYAADLAVLAATLAFVVLAGLLGLWLVSGR